MQIGAIFLYVVTRITSLVPQPSILLFSKSRDYLAPTRINETSQLCQYNRKYIMKMRYVYGFLLTPPYHSCFLPYRQN